MLAAEFTHTLEVSWLWQYAVHVPGNGFGDNTSDLITQLIESFFERVQIVKGQCHGMLSEYIGDARGAGHSESERT